MIMTNSIKISGLCKSYGDFALDHIDLKLPGHHGPHRRKRRG